MQHLPESGRVRIDVVRGNDVAMWHVNSDSTVASAIGKCNDP